MKTIYLLCALALPVLAQIPDHRNVTQLGSWDASGAKQTKPNRAGSSLPGSCTNVETYQLTTTGAQYVCVAGAWKQISGHWTLTGSDLSYTAGVVGIGGAAVAGYGLAVHGETYFGNRISAFRSSQDNFFSAPLSFLKRGNTTSATGAVKDNAELGYVDWYGWNGSTYTRAAMLIALAGGDFSPTSTPASLNFYTTPVGSTTASIRGRFTPSGNFLVGTYVDNAYGVLAADGDISAGGYGSQRGYWARSADNGVRGEWFSTADTNYIGTFTNHPFTIRTNATSRVSVMADGKVGIGKTPATALDVNGTVTATAFAGPLTGNVTGNAPGTAANVTGTIAIANGGTGQTTAATAINALVPTQTGNNDKVLGTNGSVVSWVDKASGASGVSSVNGVTGAVTLGNGSTGLAPAWSGSTLNIPLAVNASVTAGLISKVQYDSLNSREPAITPGTSAQYWRGDKTMQTLNAAAVGLGNVENTALSTWSGSASITAIGTLASGAVPWARITGVPASTGMRSINLPDPVTSDSGRFHIMFEDAVTITRVACSVKAATSVTIQLDERAAATPDTAGTSVLTSSLVCDTDEAVTTTFTNAGIAARVPLALVISAVSGTPDVVRVNISYTRD